MDAETLFVGSFNLDPRSAFLNCEQGVLVSEPVLAAQLRAIFDHETEGARAWRVTREDGELAWSDGSERHSERAECRLVAPLPGGRGPPFAS